MSVFCCGSDERRNCHRSRTEENVVRFFSFCIGGGSITWRATVMHSQSSLDIIQLTIIIPLNS